MAGTPVIDGSKGAARRAASNVRLGIGGWLETDAMSRARISVGQIGRVDVEPNTRLQLIEAHGREHRMSLSRGTIHARIWAPPRLFTSNSLRVRPSISAASTRCRLMTPAPVSCAWSAAGSASRVIGRQSFIPEGAVGATRPGTGPGTPSLRRCAFRVRRSAAILDFGPPMTLARGAAFELVLSSARRRDALTLWHLLGSRHAGRACAYRSTGWQHSPHRLPV